MSIDRARLFIGVAAAVLSWPALAACGGRGDSAQLLRQAIAQDSASNDHDPCTLLSAAEAVPYVGPLVSPPYRASDGVPDTHGDQCMYRGKDGRQVTVEPDWSGGQMMASTMKDVPNALGSALSKGGATGMDTMAHRVMAQGPAGPWDNATWIPGGSLFASKGDAEVSIDVSAASGQENDALALARLIVPRFAHPLSYDGAKAVALAPKPFAHPADPCDFMSRSVVEAAIGPLNGSPASDSSESTCTYRVSTAQGVREYPVGFVWQGGEKNYAMLKHGMSTVGGLMGTPTSSPLDTMKPPPQMQAMIGGLMKMMGGSKGGEEKAPGASSTIGFQTDTTLAGPWDNASLLHGTQLIAVRHDVFVGMTLESADYEKAKALLTAICSRL